MLRKPRPEAQYHMLAFEIFLETIKCVFAYSFLFEPNMATDLIQHLNEMLRDTSDLSQLVQYYEHLVNKVELEPLDGAEFIYKLDLWINIAKTPFNSIVQSQRLSYCFTYIILHCAFNLKSQPVPEE